MRDLCDDEDDGLTAAERQLLASADLAQEEEVERAQVRKVLEAASLAGVLDLEEVDDDTVNRVHLALTRPSDAQEGWLW
jgi:hypothetical protein